MIYITKKLLVFCAITLQIPYLCSAATGVNPAEPTQQEIDKFVLSGRAGNSLSIKQSLKVYPNIINKKNGYSYYSITSSG